MKIENSTQKGCISSYGGLLATAKAAYACAIRKSNHPTETRDNALTAVLMACVALEGYINESFGLISKGPGMKKCPARARIFADILQEIESSHGSTRLKYQVALTVLTGKPFAKGEYPFQDFDLLFSIRDALMHHKLETLTEPRLVKRLRAKKLCTDDESIKQSWHEKAFTPATASRCKKGGLPWIQTGKSDSRYRHSSCSSLFWLAFFSAIIHFGTGLRVLRGHVY